MLIDVDFPDYSKIKPEEFDKKIKELEKNIKMTNVSSFPRKNTLNKDESYPSFLTKKSLNDTKITIKAIMDVKHSVMVNDEPRVIEDCEKTAVIQFLKTNKIPLTSNTYALTLKKYLSGELNFTDVMEEKNEMLVK